MAEKGCGAAFGKDEDDLQGRPPEKREAQKRSSVVSSSFLAVRLSLFLPSPSLFPRFFFPQFPSFMMYTSPTVSLIPIPFVSSPFLLSIRVTHCYRIVTVISYTPFHFHSAISLSLNSTSFPSFPILVFPFFPVHFYVGGVCNVSNVGEI